MGEIVAFPSRGLAGQQRRSRRKRPPPARDVIEIVGFDGAVSNRKDAFHDVGTGNNRLVCALDLTDVRLAATKLGSELLLRPTLLLSPLCQLQRVRSRSGTLGYSNSLYLVNGHKQVAGADYKWMAYVLAMHPANRLRELRKAAKLNQSELAQCTGVSQPYISQVENQAATTLDIARMRVLARELHCAPADLLADEDNPDRLNEEERELIARFRTADGQQRELIQRVAEPTLRYEAGPKRQVA